MYDAHPGASTLEPAPQVKKDEKELNRGFGAGFKLDVEELMQSGRGGVFQPENRHGVLGSWPAGA